MWLRIRRHLSFANIASGLSLFIVLSTGTAVALAGSNTVLSDDIVDGQVQSADIRDRGVTGADLSLNSVTGGHIVDHSITGRELAQPVWHYVQPHPATATDPCSTATVNTFCGPDAIDTFGNVDSIHEQARYSKDVTGRVQLQGYVREFGLVDADPFFLLPVGYRPSAAAGPLAFPVHCGDGTTGAVYIYADGAVTLTNCFVAEGSFLDAVSFPAEQ